MDKRRSWVCVVVDLFKTGVAFNVVAVLSFLPMSGVTSAVGLSFDADHVVIAHRGASGYLPEHTLAGAAMAYGVGADYIELDVVMTKDNRFIVCHDLTLEATTNVEDVFPNKKRKDGKWYAVDFTLDEIKKLTVHERTGENGVPQFPGRFPYLKSHFDVPTLEDMIELVQGLNTSTGRNVGIYPEVKDYDFHVAEGHSLLGPFLDVLKKYNYTERDSGAVIQSFDAKALKAIRFEYKSKLPLVQLLGGSKHAALKTPEGFKEVATYADGIGPSIRDLFLPNSFTPAPLMSAALANKLVIHAYTLRGDDKLPPGISFETLAAKIFACGVNGVFTDHSDRLVKFIGKKTETACK